MKRKKDTESEKEDNMINNIVELSWWAWTTEDEGVLPSGIDLLYNIVKNKVSKGLRRDTLLRRIAVV